MYRWAKRVGKKTGWPAKFVWNETLQIFEKWELTCLVGREFLEPDEMEALKGQDTAGKP